MIFNLYLFENESDFLDRIDKISNIIFAISTFILTIYIFIHTNKRDSRKEENLKKIDFLKVLLLENNSDKFLIFYEKILNLILAEKSKTLLDDEKSILIQKINDEHRNFRIKFYDLVLPFNDSIYKNIKDTCDDLVSDITEYIFDQNINYLQENNINVIEDKILKSRTEVLKIIIKIR